MTVQAGIDRELPFLRAEAEARMRSTWAIGTTTGWTNDPATGVDMQTVTPLFATKGRLKAASTAPEPQVEAAGRIITTTRRRELHIPVNSPTVPAGAVAQCTAVDPTGDPSLLNVIIRLDGPAPGEQTTARRLQVSEVLT